MKSFRQYIEEAINYDSLELNNQTLFKFKSDVDDIQVPVTSVSEKKLKSVWNDWKNILTINGEIKELQKSASVGLSAYLKSYVFVTKKDLSNQKLYENKLSDTSSHKHINPMGHPKKKLKILKTDGILSMDIVSIPDSNLKVPIFKTLSGGMITPTEGTKWLKVEGLINIIRIAKLSSKKKLLDYLESKVFNDLVGEAVRMEKHKELINILGTKFKNWKKVIFQGHKDLKGLAWFGEEFRNADKLISKELGKISEKDIITAFNSKLKKFSKEVPMADLEQYVQ